MQLKTRRVDFAACTPTLGDDFMKQIAGALTVSPTELRLFIVDYLSDYP